MFRLRQNLQVFPPATPEEKVKIIDPLNGQTYFIGTKEIKILRSIAKMSAAQASLALQIPETEIKNFIEYLQKNNLLENIQKPHQKPEIKKVPAIELKKDLNFIDNEDGQLMIEDIGSNRFFSLGFNETTLLYELIADSEEEIVQKGNYSAEQIQNFIQSLAQKGILNRPALVNNIKTNNRNLFSLFTGRFKLFNPDSLLGNIDENWSWLWKYPAIIIHFAIMFFALYLWLSLGQGFHDYGFPKIFSNVFLNTFLFLIILSLILTGHELAHGLTLKSFGISVPEIGIFLLYIFPSAYTNVSGAYKLKRTIQKVWVILAGILFQAWIGSLAFCLWSFSRSHTWIADLSYLIAFASFVNLAINLNPLIKLDGYYLLTLLLNKPNLRSKAYSFLFLGFKGASSFGEGLLFFIYGILSLLYTVLLLFWIITFIWGFGIQKAPFLSLFALLLIILAIKTPLPSANPLFIPEKKEIKKQKKQFNLFPLVFLALIIMTLFVKIPYQIGGEVEVNPMSERRAIIYSPIQGIIKKLYIKSGDYVKAGDKLIEITDWQLKEQLNQSSGGFNAPKLISANSDTKQIQIQNQKLKIELEKAKLNYQNNARKAQIYSNLAVDGAFPKNTAQEAITNTQLAEQEIKRLGKEISLNKELENASRANFATLKGQIQFYEEKSALQIISSPINGYILTEDIDLQKGSIASPQEPLMSIADLSQVEIKIKVVQEDLPMVKKGQKIKLIVRAYPNKSFEGFVSQIAQMSEDIKKTDPSTIKDTSRKRWNTTMIINNKDLLLKPGMTGYAYIDSKKHKKVYEFISQEAHRVFSLERFAVIRESLSSMKF